MKNLVLAGLVSALALSGTGIALAEDSNSGMVRAFKAFLKRLPQYENPITCPNGDIILLRIKKDKNAEVINLPIRKRARCAR